MLETLVGKNADIVNQQPMVYKQISFTKRMMNIFYLFLAKSTVKISMRTILKFFPSVVFLRRLAYVGLTFF